MFLSSTLPGPARTADSPPPTPLPATPPSTAIFTAQQAEESIDFIQSELSRLLRACEYREQHPYKARKVGEASRHAVTTTRSADGGSAGGAARAGASVSALQRRDPVAGSRLSDAELPSTPPLLSGGVATPTAAKREEAVATSFSSASFSAFERRRIAHLLGRVALEIAAVWTYVHECEPFGDGGAIASMDGTTPASSAPTTARGTTRQSSDHSTAVPAASPSTPVSLGAADAGDTAESGTLPRCAWAGVTEERRRASEGNSDSRITALGGFIETAMAIRRSLDAAEDGDGSDGASRLSGSPAPSEAAPATSLTFSSPSFDGVRAVAHDAVDGVAASRSRRSSAVSGSSPAAMTAAPERLATPCFEGRTWTPRGPTLHAPPTAPESVPRTSATSSNSGRAAHQGSSGTTSSIPFYLRAYVVEDEEEAVAAVTGDVDGGGGGGGAHAVAPAQAQTYAGPGASRSASGASMNLRSFSRASEFTTPVTEDSDPARLLSLHSIAEQATRGGRRGSAATSAHNHDSLSSPLTLPTAPPCARGGGVGGGGGGGGGVATIIASRLDSDPASHGSSPRLQRALSGSSLHSASLMGSPLQAPQFGAQRSLGHSAGNTSSLPNASASQRSPDSTDMSPAAAAAYSRSTSLLRRPHRLAVPVSRTQSLRRVPSISSPISVAAASLGSAPVTGHHTAGPAPGTYGGSSLTSSHIAKSASGLRLSSGGGGGALHTSPYAAGSPPVAMGASATADSPHSSVAGLHFKRVVSLDSEGGGWAQGSLADSLEMSQHRAMSLFSRPSASAAGGALPSSPFLGETGLVTAAGSHTDHDGLLSPSTARPNSYTSIPASSAGHRSSTVPPTRAEPARTTGAQGRHATPSPAPPAAAARPRHAPLSPATDSGPAPRRVLQGTVGATPAYMAAPPNADAARRGALAADELPPYAYRIDDNVLQEFLCCIHDLAQANLTEAEFDMLELCFFIPGVTLATPPPATQSPSSSPSPAALPLALFPGGEEVPVRLGSLDLYQSLLRERLTAVCRNLRISARPYLSLL
ncbi:hypothetical protein NESM_000052800 [Novymonas esmeraldas]|uniref:Uncharacterized protein n=1 Tax=Novymonas esmeraldas TaxID=1808958 RepID=A0AAW0F0W0_9TRYP